MRIERAGSAVIFLLILGVVLWRGTATGFSVNFPASSQIAADCADNDLGFSPSIASFASVGGIELHDTCANEGLFEAVCNSKGKAEYRFVNCNYEVAAGSSCVREGLSAYCG